MIGHGSSNPNGVSNWLAGDELVVARVDPSPETINDPSAWEFLAGSVEGNPIWTRDFSKMEPIVRWPGRCGIVNATWVPSLGRYLMFVSTGLEDGGEDHYNTWVAEALHSQAHGVWSIGSLSSDRTATLFACLPSSSSRRAIAWSCSGRPIGKCRALLGACDVRMKTLRAADMRCASVNSSLPNLYDCFEGRVGVD